MCLKDHITTEHFWKENTSLKDRSTYLFEKNSDWIILLCLKLLKLFLGHLVLKILAGVTKFGKCYKAGCNTFTLSFRILKENVNVLHPAS